MMKLITALGIFFYAAALPVDAKDIRVLLGEISNRELSIEVPQGGFSVTRDDGMVSIDDHGVVTMEDGLIIRSNDGKHLYWKGKPYRGRLEIRTLPDGILGLINVLDVEDYLYSVIAGEMDTKTWPLEALKAQAVVSRSYAYHAIRSAPNAPYHVGVKTKHQVYFGATIEDSAARKAVDLTRQKILKDPEGGILPSYFHSCCGGRTEDARQVWAKTAPSELVGVSDFGSCKISPHYAWVTTLPVKELQRAMGKLGYALHGPIKSLLLGEMTKSSRVVSLRVLAGSGRVEVSTEKLRQVLGPNWIRSTRITGISRKNDRFLIRGKGWGHGVGLCQWGAKAMALKGYDFEKILRHYFPKAGYGRV